MGVLLGFFGAAFGALLSGGALGCGDQAVEALAIEVRGPAYPRPRCGKGPASLGKLDLRGPAVAKARIKLLGGSKGAARETMTDAKGAATLDGLPRGGLRLLVYAPGYRIEPRHRVTYRGGAQRTLITLQPCLSLGRPRLAVGFDRVLKLRPKNLCGKAWRPDQIVRRRWRLIEGPPVSKASIKRWDGPTLSLRTPKLTQLRRLPTTPQILSFSPEQAGQLVLELEAENKRGEVSRSHLLVTTTSVANGMTSVAPFATYVFAGNPKGPWQWKLTRVPKGWRVNLRGASSRTPSVTPHPPSAIDQPQVVELENKHSGLRFSIVLGNWNTVRRDCGRSECHRSLEDAWRATPHAQAWRRLLDGELKLARGPASAGCAGCHATGYNPFVDDGGYDEVARLHGVSMPATRMKGVYAKLPAAVKDVSNVYCLACHGPGRLDPPIAEQPGLFGVGVCARCHDRLPEHPLVAQWRTSKHAKTVTNEVNGPERRKACARCHSAQGFVYGNFSLARPHSSKTAMLNCCETVQPVTCQACHDPMRATPRKQVRRFGPIATPSGAKHELGGSGAICSMCHHADVDIASAEHLAARLAPHAPQTDLMLGRAGYELPPNSAAITLPPLGGQGCVKETRDTCVTCHMHDGPIAAMRGHHSLGGHSFAMATKAGGTAKTAGKRIEHIAACRSCHPKQESFDDPAKGDYDGDGQVEGAQQEIDGLLGLVEAALRRAITTAAYKGCDGANGPGVWIARGGGGAKLVLIDADGNDLGDCDRNGAIERRERAFTFPATAEGTRFHKAAYNWLAVKRDGSRGLHNYGYTVKLLQRTLAALPGAVPTKWTIRR
ncbi:MAG: hypothetical protein CSA65_04255 [Proteobacteria bacterium]|nr:MAG: hypothetical protein CSA65_04255 [Pseudomonadota bacterium]